MEDNFNGRALQSKAKQALRKPGINVHGNVNMTRVKSVGVVGIKRKLGRPMPDFIKTDHFNFASLVDTAQQIGKTADQVSSAVGKVSNAVNTVSGTIKTVNNGYKQLQNPNPAVNNGYNTNTQITGQQPGYVIQGTPVLGGGYVTYGVIGLVILAVIFFMFKSMNRA